MKVASFAKFIYVVHVTFLRLLMVTYNTGSKARMSTQKEPTVAFTLTP